MNKSIFKPYDIRGKYPKELDEPAAKEIAAKMGKFLKNKSGGNGKFIMGMDVRKSSRSLYNSVISGLKSAGVKEDKIVSAGRITTPMFYFLSAYFQAAGGFMITSSHEPKDTNGIKIIGAKTAFIGGEDVKKIIFGK